MLVTSITNGNIHTNVQILVLVIFITNGIDYSLSVAVCRFNCETLYS
jgi:hypothetical protein